MLKFDLVSNIYYLTLINKNKMPYQKNASHISWLPDSCNVFIWKANFYQGHGFKSKPKYILKNKPQEKKPKNKKQQKQQAPNNSWLRFVFTGLYSKSSVGFICFKFRA